MVYSGLYPIDGSDYPLLRDALDRLRLNDAALVYEPESSAALGFGFRCGFLGLLHLEITRDRLEREFDLDLISTAPNVVNRVILEDGGTRHRVRSGPRSRGRGRHQPVRLAVGPEDRRDLRADREVDDHRAERVHRRDHGAVPAAARRRCAAWTTCPRPGSSCGTRCRWREIIFDFFDQLKSRTRGYASLDYEQAGEQTADLVKVDILLQGEPVDAFSAIVHKDKAYAYGTIDDGQAARADPAPAVRGADPGRHRLAGDRAREHPRHAQGRAGQVLRR